MAGGTFATSSVRCEPSCIVVRDYFLKTRTDKSRISSVEWTTRDLALWQVVFFFNLFKSLFAGPRAPHAVGRDETRAEEDLGSAAHHLHHIL